MPDEITSEAEPNIDDIAAAMADDAEEQDEEEISEEQEAPEIEAADDEPEEVDEVSDEEESSEADPEEDHSQADWTPPISMSADEQEKFKALPPEAQEYLVRREQDRERHFSSKGNEMATQRQAIEAVQAEAETMKEQLKEALSHWAASEPQMPDIGLSVEDPVEYTRQMAIYQQTRDQKDKADRELYAIQEAEQQKAAKTQQEWVANEAETLRKLVPEFADPKKASKLQQSIKDYAASTYGVSAEQLSKLDALSVAVLNKARMYDETTAKAATIKTQAKPAPKSSKPGTPKGTSTKSRTIENFEKNPSIDSLAAMYAGN